MTKKQLIAELAGIAVMIILCIFSAFSVEADSTDDSYETASAAVIAPDPVSGDKIDIVIVEEEDMLTSGTRIAIGAGLICGAVTICFMCMKTLRKENIR